MDRTTEGYSEKSIAEQNVRWHHLRNLASGTSRKVRVTEDAQGDHYSLWEKFPWSKSGQFRFLSHDRNRIQGIFDREKDSQPYWELVCVRVEEVDE